MFLFLLVTLGGGGIRVNYTAPFLPFEFLTQVYSRVGRCVDSNRSD